MPTRNINCSVCHKEIPRGSCAVLLPSELNAEMLSDLGTRSLNIYSGVFCAVCWNMTCTECRSDLDLPDIRFCSAHTIHDYRANIGNQTPEPTPADALNIPHSTTYYPPYSSYFRNYRKEPFLLSEEAGRIVPPYYSFGVELEVIDESGVVNELPSYVGIAEDHSLSENGVEIITPPLKGKAGERTIRLICKFLQKNAFSVDKSCGFHLHIEGKELKKNAWKLRSIIIGYSIIEDILISMLPQSRRENNFCLKMEKLFSIRDMSRFNTIENIEKLYYNDSYESIKKRKAEKYDNMRYYGLNLHSLFMDRGTIEIRYHSGTINTEKILRWIEIHQKIIIYLSKSALAGKVGNLSSVYDVRKKTKALSEIIGLSNNTRDYIISRINENN